MNMSKCPRCGYRLLDRNKLAGDYPQAFSPWTPDADRTLAKMAGEGVSILEISEALGRQPTAIPRRLEKLGITLKKKSEGDETEHPKLPIPVPESTLPL